MEDFLNVLKSQLMDSLPPGELEEQIALYRRYINAQVAEGQTMEQVLAKLGDPAKVAELIVEHEADTRAQREKEQYEKQRLWKKDMTVEEINAQIENPPEHGVHAEYKESEGWDVRAGKVKLNSWYFTLIILGAVLVIYILINQLLR